MFSVLNHNIEKSNDQSKFNFIFFNFNVNIRGSIVIGVRAIFCRGGGGGAVSHLPKKFSQVAQIFTKQSKRKEGHTMH